MTLTQEQRIAIIKHAVQDSKGVGLKTSLEDFVSEIKSQEVLGEHGLINNQKHDIEDEMSLIDTTLLPSRLTKKIWVLELATK